MRLFPIAFVPCTLLPLAVFACGDANSTVDAGPETDAAATVDGAPAGDASTTTDGAASDGAASDADGGPRLDGGAAPTAAGTIVPLYDYPTGANWTAIVAAKRAHPRVTVEAIVNPDNGPGAAQDGTFVSALGKLTAVGIVPFGYIATNYGKKGSAAVKLEIDAYRRMYPAVTGIFFDEMSDVAADAAYYRALTAYAKQKGFSRTVGNPGTDVPESLIGAVDTLFIYESAGTPALAPLAGWHASYPAKNFGIIPYKVATLDPVFVQRARATIGFIYLTNDDLPDPWDTLPPYFDALLGALE